uniref:Uncharacterized protein n=1 Tax=Cannabis sativa TaxID=3483 RepID=A0A803P9J9_CANSA
MSWEERLGEDIRYVGFGGDVVHFDEESFRESGVDAPSKEPPTTTSQAIPTVAYPAASVAKPPAAPTATSQISPATESPIAPVATSHRGAFTSTKSSRLIKKPAHLQDYNCNNSISNSSSPYHQLPLLSQAIS